MNKKRLYMFLSVMLIVLVSGIYLLLRTPPESQPQMLTVEKEDEIDLFYYRAVPGLKRAEDLELVVPVHKRYQFPQDDRIELKIDRIWYNEKDVFVFYHVENLDKAAFLGGELSIGEPSPENQTVFWGTDAIGRDSEKGVVYKGNFYSCLRLPPLQKEDDQSYENIQTIYFSPFLVISKEKTPIGEEINEGIRFDPFSIDINYKAADQSNEKHPLDASMVLQKGMLKFYQVNIGSSFNRLFFLLTNQNKDVITNIQGTVSADNGEYHPFNAVPRIITSYPYHYYIDLPPFDKMPESLEVTITSIDFIGDSELSFTLNTKDYKKKGRQAVSEQIGKLYNTQVFFEDINIQSDFVWLGLRYNTTEDMEKPFRILQTAFPIFSDYAAQLKNTQDLLHPMGNIISVVNENYNSVQEYNSTRGISTVRGQRLNIALPREFWNNSQRVIVHMENLAFQETLDKKILLEINK